MHSFQITIIKSSILANGMHRVAESSDDNKLFLEGKRSKDYSAMTERKIAINS